MLHNVPDFIVTDAARAVIPGIRAYGFTAEDLPAEPRLDDLAQLALDDRITVSDLATLAGHPRIAPWREAYRTMGLKPSEFRSSIEQLVRRALSGRPAVGAHWLIERYNGHSLAHLTPMGGYDLDQITEDAVIIRPSLASDRFTPLGGHVSQMPLGGNILVYAQAMELLCWAINHRDAAHSSLSHSTCRALFIADAVDEVGQRDARAALEAFAEELHGLGARCSAIRAFMSADADKEMFS